MIPSNDFSFYDQVLDPTCLVGSLPARFGWRGGEVDLDTRFAIVRGVRPKADAAASTCRSGEWAPAPVATFASEMTKRFDTNYPHVVPEFGAETQFELSATKVVDEFSETLGLGIETKPLLIGHVTYRRSGKCRTRRIPT